ncbi:MAG: hypothetical protein AAGF74_07660 [Pseudomonadota bacterium]
MAKSEDITLTKTAASEDDAVEEVRAWQRQRIKAPDLEIDFDPDDRTAAVSYRADDPLKAQALAMHEMGTGDVRFFLGLSEQIAALALNPDGMSERIANFAHSVVGAIQPRDEIEAMLAVQMAATHQATMVMVRKLNCASSTQQQDAAERAYNKLARTFTTQMDALKKYRAKAPQTVRVEEVNVGDGGQAIVGNVQHGGADDKT